MQIGQHQAHRSLAQHGQGLVDRGTGVQGHRKILQGQGDELPDGGIILHQQHAGLVHAGAPTAAAWATSSGGKAVTSAVLCTTGKPSSARA